MRSMDITEFMDREETPETRAFAHALDLEFIVLDEMEKQGISKKELAERMRVLPSRLSKLLNDQPNMTFETVASFELALGFDLELRVKAKESHERERSASFENRTMTNAFDFSQLTEEALIGQTPRIVRYSKRENDAKKDGSTFKKILETAA